MLFSFECSNASLDIRDKFGAYCMRDTPVPMSNTAVKSHYAGSSWGLPPVRYGRCQAKRSDCEAAFIGSLAQLGEHLPYKQRVGGSNPSTPIRSLI